MTQPLQGGALDKRILIQVSAPLSDSVGMWMSHYVGVQPNAILDVPVRVRGFSDILSIQGVILWDPETLQLETVTNFNLPGFNPSIHLGSPAEWADGILRFGWLNSVTEGVTLVDSSSIFTLRFKAIGAAGAMSTLRFSELPPATYFELVKADLSAFGFSDLSLVDGSVSLAIKANSSFADIRRPILSAGLSPNPCGPKGDFVLHLDLEVPSELSASALDASGRIIFSEKNIGRFSAGAHLIAMRLPSDAPAGMYQLALRAANQLAVLPLIKQ
ncbi:MAG: cohesin domain-containing protein [Saprospiraceae bacterium]